MTRRSTVVYGSGCEARAPAAVVAAGDSVPGAFEFLADAAVWLQAARS